MTDETSVISVAELLGLDTLSEVKDTTKKMGGSKQIQLFTKQGFADRNIDHLKGSVELINEAFGSIITQLRQTGLNESDTFAMVFILLAKAELSSAKTDKDSMLVYGMKTLKK